MKVCILTYGCQMNVHDSEVIKNKLHQLGYSFTDDTEQSDMILIVSCCVRESAEKRIYGRINYFKKLKYKNPSLIIGLMGCLAQKDKKEVFKNAPHIDFALGPQEIGSLENMILSVKAGKRSVGDFKEREFIVSGDRVIPDNPYVGWISIMKGCDNYCSYCIVPYVRGHEVSKPFEYIVDEMKYLSSLGIKDVTLLGQNVNSYGKGLEENIDFTKLLSKIDKLNIIPRIRFMTSHPKDMDISLIDVIGKGKNLCEHIHLPVQAGSNRVLKEMNRKYDIETYLKKIEYIKKTLKGYAITSDIIVGFPGEKEEDFEKTIELVKKVRYDAVHTFVYSKRSGTKAAEMSETVPEETKQRWIKKLIDVQNPISLEINQSLEGKEFEVYFEGFDNKGENLKGRTRNNKIVVVKKKDETLLGEFRQVRITQGQHWCLMGELL